MPELLGSILLFAGPFNPINYAECDGAILPIMNNPGLFSILGTVYGGDGKISFALPSIPRHPTGARYLICVNGIYPTKRD